MSSFKAAARNKSETATGDGARRHALFEAAAAVFMRYGFRKTSMDEVAQAAGISRQGLYLHFATKEELFVATLRHVLGSALQQATQCLETQEQPFELRLVAALDAWMGRFVGSMGPGASDIVQASNALLGPIVAEHEQQFHQLLVKALRASGLPAHYKDAGVGAPQLVATLLAAARGLKYSCKSPPEFSHQMAIVVRVLCVPIRGVQ